MAKICVFVCLVVASCALCKPVENVEEIAQNTDSVGHNIAKRFVNPFLTSGGFDNTGLVKMRTKRNAEECEKLQLCKLHARSNRNFLAAFELYFVNKENARLWDHQRHSIADCNRRFSCYDR